MIQGFPRRVCLWSSLIVLVTGYFILIDVSSYYFIPQSWTRFAPRYRLNPASGVERGRGYPRYYFHADPLLGFDITPHARANHMTFDGLEYDIFANDLGCFDKNNLADFVVSPTGYAYFAGDSFTWGYARYEDKFGTVWEKETGILAAKCGVTHSGTLHQFEKFKRIMQKIGRLPKVVFVGFFPNDIDNNLAFPHTTVIEGYQVDTIFLTGKGQLSRVPYEELVREVSLKIKAIEEPQLIDSHASQSIWMKIKAFLLRRSLIANMVHRTWKHMPPAESYTGNLAHEQDRLTSKFGRSFYRLFNDPDIRTKFALSPMAVPTKQAIAMWSDDAKSRQYRLVFLLIPPASNFNRTDLFDQVKEFLRAHQVEFLDLALLFNERGWSRDDLYWKEDPHLSDVGNRRIGLELSLLGY